MLERTAVGLESCTLQRVLPKPTTSCRRLHTAFWQHGASALEICNSWPGLPRAVENETSDGLSSSQPPQSSLMASVLWLDFLYPATTLPLLRRMYPRLPKTEESRYVTHLPRRRQFSSSTTEPNLETIDEGKTGSGESSLDESHAARRSISSLTHDDQMIELDTLLADDNGHHYEAIWELYNRLDHGERSAVWADVVIYLSQSHDVFENGRALSIFRQIPVAEWDDDLLTTGILLFLRAGDANSAVEKFKVGLESKGLDGGLEYLLADAITSGRWKQALDVWIVYCTAEVGRSKKKPTTKRLEELKGIPNQGKLYFAFRSYLATDGAAHRREIVQSIIPHAAFRLFQRHFARRALMEPCQPAQAAVILETLQDPGLYNEYFEMILAHRRLNSMDGAHLLPKMYEQFRALPDAEPTLNVLQSMFNFYYPNNIASLEILYKDWIRWRGSLDKWGYEKFLKLYAARGEVGVVDQLWVDFVSKYPDMLKKPRGFRSVLNVCAQTGNPAQVEKVMQEMVEVYKCGTDIDCYNMLLKAYVRADDYDKVLSCFEEASQLHTPDSRTYSHVLAMTSKKGDLDATLDIFNRSQEADVEITKEMTLGLIVAYCQNDLLQEAESLCTELAQRGLTHTTTWNQLLNFNGEAGNLTQCHVILGRMKEFGMEWNEDTYRFLLQAIVNVDQIQAAASILKDAEDQKLFIISPDHYAIVLAGAARCGQHALLDSLRYRMQKQNVPLNFSGMCAVVESAVRQKPGVGRTLNLSKELLGQLRRSLDTIKNAPGETVAQSESRAFQQGRFHIVGRAINLLVQLRQFGTAEELMTIFNEMFPEYKKSGRYPPNVTSALMAAYFQDGDVDKTLELWDQTWASTLEESRKPNAERIYAGHRYDLVRAITVAIEAYRKKNDASGLSDCIDKIHEQGFKLTNASWSLAIRYLSEMDRWEQAMYWCETMLMPGWRGWNWGRENKEKAFLRNTRALRAPRNLVIRLQPEWLKLRSVAAWDGKVSQRLKSLEERFPRLFRAFATPDVRSLKVMERVNTSRKSARDIDRVVRTIPYVELLKVKGVLRKQLAKERQREKDLGIDKLTPTDTEERGQWKDDLQDHVKSYAVDWADRRTKHHTRAKHSGDTQSKKDNTLKKHEESGKFEESKKSEKPKTPEEPRKPEESKKLRESKELKERSNPDKTGKLEEAWKPYEDKKHEKARILNQAQKLDEAEQLDWSLFNPDQLIANQRIRYWNSFFDRYDQRPHGGSSHMPRPRFYNQQNRNRTQPRRPSPRKKDTRYRKV